MKDFNKCMGGGGQEKTDCKATGKNSKNCLLSVEVSLVRKTVCR